MVLNKKLKIISDLEFYKSFGTIKTDWWKKTPNEKWCHLYAVGRTMPKLIFISIFEEDQSVHWYSYCSHGVVGFYALLALYTAYYYVMHGEPEKFFPCTCLLGIICCYMPFIAATMSKDRKRYHSLLTFAGRYIYPDNYARTEYNRMCSKQIDWTMKSYILKIFILLLSGFCAVLGPIYAYIMYGTKTTTIEVKIPSFEDDPNTEYALNMSLQSGVFIHGILVYFATETAISIFADVIKIIPKLIQYRLNELLETYERMKITELELRYSFTDITKQILDYENFVSGLRDFLYWRTLVTPVLFTYSIAMAIFCQFTMGFAAGYGMAAMSWIQFYFICETGQDIEDNGLDEILYDSDWYHLPRDLQKDLMHLINQRQNRITLNVGPFAIINRDLLKAVTNKIYSIIMFLLNFTG